MSVNNRQLQPPKPVEASPATQDETRTKAGIRQRLLPIALLIAALLLLLVYRHARTPSLTNVDALDFAQIGRNMASGRGFTTYALRPLALTHASDPLRQPDVMHGPLYPLVLAVAFGAFGAKDSVVMGVSGLFYLLTIPMLFLLGTRVFNRTVALIATAVFAFNALILEYAASGLHITLYCFLTTALFLALYNLAGSVNSRQQQKKSSDVPLPIGQLMLVGLFTALLYLTDPIFVWLMPVVFVFVAWLSAPRGIAAAAAFLVPIGVVALPWMIRNGGLTGNPIFGERGMELWMYTKHGYPGDLAYRLFPEQVVIGPTMFGSVVRKLLMGISAIVTGLPQICASWILVFMLPCLLFRYTSAAANRLRAVMLCCFAALIIGMLLFQVEMPLLVAIVPVMLVFSVGYLVHLVQEAQPYRSLRVTMTALLVIALTYPLCSQIALDDKIPPLPEESVARGLQKMAKPGEVILSDRPQVVAWYSDRPSILIPARDESIAVVRKQFSDTRWLLLTQQVRSYSPQWQYLYDKFQARNTQFLQAQSMQVQPPESLHVSGQGDTLFVALAGFTSVDPESRAGASTVLAAVSAPEVSLLQEGKTP